MKQILRLKKLEQNDGSDQGDLDFIDQSTLQDAEERYQVLVFKKEEQLLQQEQMDQQADLEVDSLLEKL